MAGAHDWKEGHSAVERNGGMKGGRGGGGEIKGS